MFKINEAQPISTDTLRDKYCKEINGVLELTEDDIFKRVSKAVASVEKTPAKQNKWANLFYENMKAGAIGAGRIMGAAGAGINVSLLNCYVQPVADSILDIDKDGYPGIYVALAEAAETMRRGGGVGYDFSRIRPLNAKVKGTLSFASGPCSYMDVFDKSCETVESAGCFAGETLIHTTEGFVTIKEIVDSNKDWYVQTHLGPRKITAKFNNGQKELWRVVTGYGYTLRVTPEHKFAQFENGKIVTKSIEDIYFSDNKSLLLLTPHGVELTPEWTNGEKEAYLIGAFYGNGSWYYNAARTDVKGINISNNTTKQAIVDRIEAFATDLGLNTKTNKVPTENTLSTNIYSVDFFRAWKQKGIDKGTNLRIPECILKGSMNERAAFIAGLMDADGHVSEIKSNIRLRMISLNLLSDVQTLLTAYGVPATVKLERDQFNNWKPIFSLGIYGRLAQTRYNATVGKFTVKTLENYATRDRVGYSHRWTDLEAFGINKQSFKNFWNGNVNTHPTVSSSAIVAIVNNPELINTISDHAAFIHREAPEVVYDVEVEEAHLLSGNGVYTSNSRRGAQMGVLRVDHPDVELFITAKRTKNRWNNFNVSVFVSDAFMEAVKNDTEWELVHTAEPTQVLIEKNQCYQRADGKWVYEKIKARDLWEKIMRSNYDYAEPGILFGDSMNRDNNLRYIEVIEATNPCAEEPLPPYGCCNLGPLILTKFVKNPFTLNASFDFTAFELAAKIQVRFLDNVLDLTYYPIEKQLKESHSKRRIGVGFTGIGNTLAMLGVRYNTKEAQTFARNLAERMRNACYRESVELAKEKGAFPLFDADKYLEEGTFASRLPEDIKALIRKHGIRNSHLLSIAPTGTVSLAFADNASNGIEPPFSWVYNRKKRRQDNGFDEYLVMDHSFRVFLNTLLDQSFAEALCQAIATGKSTFTYNETPYETKACLPESMVTALELSSIDHMAMLKAVQPYIDTSISKTINVPADYPFEDFKNIYLQAFDFGLKGVATYRPNTILGSVLSEIKSETTVKTQVNPEEVYNKFMTEDHPKRPAGRLYGCSDKYEYFNSDGAVKFYVGASFIETDIALGDNSTIRVRRPIELFINSEMNVGNEWGKLLGITMSQIARTSIYKLADYLMTCQKMRGDRGSIRFGYIEKPNGGKAPRYHGSDIAVMAYAIQNLFYHEGIFDKHGNPVKFKDIVSNEEVAVINYVDTEVLEEPSSEIIVATGSICTECGAPSVIKKDGCKFCTSCGAEGSCG